MKKVFSILITGLAVVLFSGFSALHSSGYTLATGSPYDGGACGQCHTGTVGSVSVDVVASPAFGAGNTYLPGATYTISAVVAGSFAQYGFDLEMLNSNASASVSDAGVCGPALTSNCQKVTFATNPTNYTHTAPSGSGNSATFSFEWTAPANGSVYIYCAGLGANGNHADNGDRVKTFALMLSPSVGIPETEDPLQNLKIFPNPSSGEIKFLYGLNEAGTVTAKVCDLDGREILDLINKEQGAGIHEFALREKLPAGVYLVQFFHNGKQSAKKFFVE